MTSADVVREAAVYLEYFLEGLSECNVVGSYAVQFLELRSFNDRLEASLADHLVCLLVNMKGLLMKLDKSLIPFHNVGAQTEGPVICSLCNGQSSICAVTKPSHLQDSKPPFDEVAAEKSYESPEIVQLLNSSPLIQLKQEVPCISNVSPKANTFSRKDDETNIIHIESADLKDTLNLEPCSNPEIKSDKCSMALSFQAALDDGINIEYATTSHLDGGQGEILLDHMGGSDTSASEGLMYSTYTMSSCGSFQLVSRVLSKNSSLLKDNLNEPVEKAMIEINSLKEELGSQVTFESLALEEGEIQDQTMDTNGESITVTPDTLLPQGNLKERLSKAYAKVPGKMSKSTRPKSKRAKTVEKLKAYGSALGDVVKLGPEDLGNGTWCNICEKEFPSMASLKAHITRTHSKVKWCNTCNKTIGSEDMSCHVQEYHSDLPYVCNVCGQSLRTSGALQRHLDIHKGVRGSACDVCGQTFSRTEYYKDHIRLHTGEKPFKCETCKKTFARSSNLYAHMAIHNSEEQRHICNLCLKSFARADKLKEHLIRHMQSKRYACRLCSKSYRERRDLVKHLSKIHSTEDEANAD